MNLKFKKDFDLVNELKKSVEQERKISLEILHYLREVETRRIYLERGYPSLFEWATQELGYSAGAAQRRIQSMRLLKALPEIAPSLASGELSLSVASQAQSFFRREDQKRREAAESPLSLDNKREIVQSLMGASSRECERTLATISPESALSSGEKLRALSAEQTLVQFVASRELMDKLEELKGLLAHQNYNGRMDQLVELVADLALKKLRPKKPQEAPQNVNQKENQTDPKGEPSSRVETKPAFPTSEIELSAFTVGIDSNKSRYIPVSIRRAVWQRDQGRCTFRDPETGHLCESRHAIEFDHHPVPFSMGGVHSVENLALRCRSHNLHQAIVKLGEQTMRPYVGI